MSHLGTVENGSTLMEDGRGGFVASSSTELRYSDSAARAVPWDHGSATDFFSLKPSKSMDAVCARRIRKLETFTGDEDLGYPKPETIAVEAVKALLSAIYTIAPNIESPTISPSRDGEVLVSWRREQHYLVCHFSDSADFEWVFKMTLPIAGVANALNFVTQYDLARILTYFLDPNSKQKIPHVNAMSIAPEGHGYTPDRLMLLAKSI